MYFGNPELWPLFLDVLLKKYQIEKKWINKLERAKRYLKTNYPGHGESNSDIKSHNTAFSLNAAIFDILHYGSGVQNSKILVIKIDSNSFSPLGAKFPTSIHTTLPRR